MTEKVKPSITWISEQFTKSEKVLVSGEGDIRSRMYFAVPWIYWFDPGAIPDEQLRKKIVIFRQDLEGKYASFTEAIKARRFSTLSKLAVRISNLNDEVHGLTRTLSR